MSIKILPSHVSDQIAAGEVVERPASVIKELVENSIDAGAKNIEIWVENGGRTRISVKDDGKGMSAEDAKLCVLRHATSKIQTIDDLFSIRSFGFRGEALAAISAVSRFELLTKRSDAPTGTKIILHGGIQKSIEPAPANTGTHSTITDLFYTTPVRLEYLKTDETEYRQILKEVVYFALSFPDISFKLWKNDSLVQDYPSAKNLKDRIEQVLPKVTQKLLSVEISSPDTKIRGYICEADSCTNNKNHQYLFVNGRHIQDFTLSFAVREAYRQSAGIEKDLFPIFVLFIETDPILVDVNVHPRKLEIKFSEPEDIFRLIKQGVTQSLQSTTMAFQNSSEGTFTGTNSQTTSRPYSHTSFKSASTGNTFSKSLFSGIQNFSDLSRHRDTAMTQVRESNPQQETQSPTIQSLTAIAQIAQKYILAQSDEGIFLFDQHALHERERFEVLWKQYKSKDTIIQKLLTPQEFTLTEEEISLLHEHRQGILSLGFAITFPTDSSIEISEVPSIFAQKDLEYVINFCIQYFQNNAIGEHVQDHLMRKLIEYQSCRGAIMYGDSITLTEAQRLLDDFLTTQWSGLCPHGRPNHIFWSFDELDKRFYR